jgi:FixJ family two-component response regulator
MMSARLRVVAIIEDDPSMLSAVARLLRAHGVIPETYASAEAFLVNIAASKANCLLIDIHLGGLSGIDLCRRLKAYDRFRNIILMTAVDNKVTENKAIEAGCTAYLRKPFSDRVLIDAIAR